MAHLWKPNFNWQVSFQQQATFKNKQCSRYDVPCKLRGFPIDEKRGGVTFNPLCEHEPSQEETDTFMEGLDQVTHGQLYINLDRMIFRNGFQSEKKVINSSRHRMELRGMRQRKSAKPMEDSWPRF